MLAIERLDERLPEKLEGRDLLIGGVVSGLPQWNEKMVRFDFKLDHSESSEGFRLPSKIRISWFEPKTTIEAGQRWRMTVRLKRPHGTMNPGGFDYERWLLINGIGATGYVRPRPYAVQLPVEQEWIEVSQWRQSISDQLTKLFKGSERQGILKALIIGDRHEISQEQWDVFRKTGTVHLIAISGLHIGLIAGLVYLMALKFWAYLGVLSISPPVVAAISALTAGFFYAAMAGFSIPTLRALIMLLIVMAALILRRNAGIFHALAAALFVIAILDPFAVLSPGFWLSFTAVVVIIICLTGRRQSPSYWHSLLKINWVASFGLVPLLMFYFQQVSLIAPLANLVAVPIVSFLIVPLALVSTLVLQFLPDFGGWLFHVADVSLEGLYAILRYLAEFPYSNLKAVPPNVWEMIFALSGVFMLLLPRGIPCRWLGMVLMLPMVFPAMERMKEGAFQLTLLDVGQGLSTVIQTRNHALVFDSGAKFSSGSDMGGRVVLPFLRNQGLDQLDILLISHGDNDHIGGADSILAGVKVKQIISSVPDQFTSHEAIACRQGQQWVWDQVMFKILSPPSPGFESENDNSCVLKIQSEHGSALLTGDIEKTAEEWLVSNYSDTLQVHFLIAPHHGSDTSSTLKFLQKVKPDLILISAGYKNRFRHPSEKVLNRYHKEGVNWYNIANEGAVDITVSADQIEISRYRTTDGQYWNESFGDIR